MEEPQFDLIKRYDAAHERLRALLGPLYHSEGLETAFSYNPSPEPILDELEQALKEAPQEKHDAIRRRWLEEHISDLD